MRVAQVPAALRVRLGPEATDDLLATLDQVRHEWTDDVMTRAAERFEHRLTVEIAGLRTEFREALAAQGADLRTAIARECAGIRGEIATSRTDLVRWLFIVWTGQFVALAALLNALL